MKRSIVPSILAADFADLARDVRRVQSAGAESVQVDVMDGHFVPNLSVGPAVVAALHRETSLFLDLHLMIENPLRFIDAFAKAGAGLITVHWEACRNPAEAIGAIKQCGIKAGLAIRPKTGAEVLDPFLRELDMALVMTVEPGFGGQSFMPEMLDKVRALRRRIDAENGSCRLQVDGGINFQTAPLAAAAGADSLVAGTAVFGAPDAAQAFRQLQALVASIPVDFPSQSQVK